MSCQSLLFYSIFLSEPGKETQDGSAHTLTISKRKCYVSVAPKIYPKRFRSRTKLIRDVKRAIFSCSVRAASPPRLPRCAPLFLSSTLSLSVSLALPVLCCLNHSSGSLRGRLPLSFPPALLFSFSTLSWAEDRSVNY